MQSLNNCGFKRPSVKRRRPREPCSDQLKHPGVIFTACSRASTSPTASYCVICSVKPQPGRPAIVSSGVERLERVLAPFICTAPCGRSLLRVELIYPSSWPAGAQVRLWLTHWMTDWLAELQQPASCTSVSGNGPPAELAAVQSPVNRTEQETGCGRVHLWHLMCVPHSVVSWKPVFPQCRTVMMVKASAPTSKQSRR